MSMLRTFFLGLAIAALALPASAAPLRPDAGAAGESRVIKVQTGDAAFRIGQLEEQIRGLNGRLEELGFQLLQMQEQIRQMQEDNEFRFQELEKGGGGGKRTEADPAPAVTEPGSQQAGTGLPGVEDTATASTGEATTGTPPGNLGSLTFDQNGNLQTQAAPGGSETASLASPEDLYQAGYNHMLAGDYKLAEGVFRDYVDIHPDGPQAADAMFWLGEAQYSQSLFTEAAKTFLDAHKRYPQADKGPDTLLKLGMSLAALKKRDTACSTYREVLIRYPGSSQAVRKKVAEEQAKASC